MTFICVVIDEIEDLACQRQTSSKSSEPHDSVRAVNALLVALDKLRYRPNVLIFCTSNLIDSVVSPPIGSFYQQESYTARIPPSSTA